jgi:hypothetical protein
VFGDDKVLDSRFGAGEPGSEVKLGGVERIPDWADRFYPLERFPNDALRVTGYFMGSNGNE